jgi:hypothetical protein
VDFTREPIIESVITPKEGCKLVVRSSKGAGQEEFFVDAVEIVSFGGTFFLRSLEKPKAFLVPATDYEVLEVRETRMVLKNVGLDRSIKIGGGREGREGAAPKRERIAPKEPAKTEVSEPPPAETKTEPKRRERRRHYRKRRGRETGAPREGNGDERQEGSEERIKIPTPEAMVNLEQEGIGKPIKPTSALLSSLLPPPPTLISESIERYKGNELFKNVFIPKEERRHEEAASQNSNTSYNEFEDEPTVELEAPHEQSKFFTFDDEFEDVEEEAAYDSSEEEAEGEPEAEEEEAGAEKEEQKDEV